MDTIVMEKLFELLERGVGLRPSALVYVAVVATISTFLGSYLRTKGQNLATKEDIEGITEKIEQVKTGYAARLEELFQRNRLQLAAIDQRLKAHQKAYSLWRKLLSNAHNRRADLTNLIVECETWWKEHCLYLSQGAREAFMRAVQAAALHKEFLGPPRDSEGAEQNWAKIEAAGDAIVQGAGLPGLGDNGENFSRVEVSE